MVAHKVVKFYLILCITILLSQSTLAASSCEALFGSQKKTVLHKIESKLAAHDYIIKKNSLYKRIKGKKVEIGQIEIIQPQFLFEWQDKSFHEDWIKNKGVIKSEMDFILNSSGQTHGRGYYVSLSPTDSQNYGTHLTVFEVSEPMALLKMNEKRMFEHDPKVVKELRTVGFAGFRGTKTWISIINEKYLNDAKKISADTLAKMLEPNSQVPPFSQAQFLSIPSVRKEIKMSAAEKIQWKQLLSSGHADVINHPRLKQILLTDPVGSFADIANHKNRAAVMHAFLNRLTFADFTQWSDNLKIVARGNEANITKFNANFEKILADIPAAESFLALFDAFDIATISRPELKESLSLKEMISSSETYQTFLNQTNLKSVKTADEFSEKLKGAFNLDFGIRDYDVVMTPYQRGKNTIKLTSANFHALKRNIFLDVVKVAKVKHPTKFLVEAQVTYFGIDQLDKAQHLLTPDELQKITIALGSGRSAKKRAIALQIAQTILVDKLFNPKEFAKICNVFGRSKVDPFTLYKAFVSLHPYKDGNGRAARLYYRWLVLNHFPEQNPMLKLLLNDTDLLQTQFYAEQDLTWNLTRLWIMSASTESEMVHRAQVILKKDDLHHYSLESNSLDQADLINSLGPVK